MKKILLSLALAAFIFSCSAQDSLRTKARNNEFGIDATGFLKQFININVAQYPENYTQVYYLTYRRHFKLGNIRFAIGGNFTNRDQEVGSAYSATDFHYKTNAINVRVGWEFFNNLGKRWQVYYGIDFKQAYSYTQDDVNGYDGSYAYGYKSKYQTYGLSPLLGFKFKILKRLSISTEASFMVYMQQREYRRFYTPLDGTLPAIPDNVSPIIKNLSTSFQQPISVFIAFDF